QQSVVQGNFIGTDRTGTKRLDNAWAGIGLDANFVHIVGNVISGNGIWGVTGGGGGNVFQGNFIGTDVTGTKALANAADGIFIGGTETYGGAGAGNLISGNRGAGIRF